MKLTAEDKKQFKVKIGKLNNAKKQLKREFVGLDDVIDEVSSLIEPWYLFPESQIRPTIVNLWGMTGVGKTSLIVRLFDILNVKTVYKFDIGDYCGDNSEQKLKYKISDSITKLKDDNLFVMVFDEFQLGRTVTDQGDEIDRGALRILWELYDTGKIEIMNSSYNTTRMFILSQKLEECVNNGVTCIKGEVTENTEFFCKAFGIEQEIPKPTKDGVDKVLGDDDDDDDDEPLYFVRQYYHWTIADIWEDRFLGSSDVKTYLKTLNEKDTLKFINETLERSIFPVIHDFSNALIFNIGNLDEAYRIANDVNPDSDADFLYEYTKKITLPQIKSALMNRYRPEQIARLGNNHVIYKSFNSEMYYELIELQLTKFKDKVKTKFDLEIECDESVNDILYKEGVFPTQGTRPVFSTVASLIESYTGKIISDIVKKDRLDVTKLIWSYKDKKHIVKFYNKKGEEAFTKKYSVLLKTEKLRENTKDDNQALAALHEAGHAVCTMVSAKLLPKHVVSKTADSEAGGFCMTELPEYMTAKLTRDRIVYALGGYAAERLVFGPDTLTNGSSSDIETVTERALAYVKLYGMSGKPMVFGPKSVQTAFDRTNEDLINADRKAFELVENCLKEAEDILKRESKLLYEIASYLSENSRMDSEMLKEFHDKYAVNKVEFKTKDNYYDFKEKLGNLK